MGKSGNIDCAYVNIIIEYYTEKHRKGIIELSENRKCFSSKE